MPTLFCCGKPFPLGIFTPVLHWTLPQDFPAVRQARILFSLYPDFTVLSGECSPRFPEKTVFRPPVTFPPFRRIYWRLILRTDAGEVCRDAWFETALSDRQRKALGIAPRTGLPFRWTAVPGEYAAARVYLRCSFPAVFLADDTVCLRTGESGRGEYADLSPFLREASPTSLELRPAGILPETYTAEAAVFLRTTTGTIFHLHPTVFSARTL